MKKSTIKKKFKTLTKKKEEVKVTGVLKDLIGKKQVLIYVPEEIVSKDKYYRIPKGLVTVREVYKDSNNMVTVYWKNNTHHDMGYFDGESKYTQPSEEQMKQHRKEQAETLFKYPGNVLAHQFTIGADPEVFVGEGDKLINAFDFLPSKKNAVMGAGGNRAYWDGFQAEFDLPSPAPTCLDGLTSQIGRGLMLVLEQAQKKHPNAMLLPKSVVNIPPEALADGKEEHVQFGCMPSFNAYGMRGLELHGREVPFRPAGGHMHFGIGQTTEVEANKIVRAMDAIIGVASVSMFGKWDDNRRRQLYGLAGEYRLPKHGLEYRVLSNAWTFHPLLCYMTFDLARKALMLGKLGLFDETFQTPQEEVIRVINENDIDGARSIMKANKKLFVAVMTAAHGSTYSDAEQRGEVAYEVWMKGADFIVKDKNDIRLNWTGNHPWRFRDNFENMKKKVG